MAVISNATAISLIDALFQGTNYTAPTTLYIALLTTNCVASDTGTTLTAATGTGVEVTGGNYSRQAVTSNSTNWPLQGSGGAVQNNSAITWSGVTWSGTVVGLAICTAATNGAITMFAPLTTSKTVSSGDTFTISSGNLAASLS
jgi:hypothetical protein